MIKVSQNFSDSSCQRMTLVQMFWNFTFVITLASGASYSRMMTADIMRCDSCPDSIHVYPFVKFRACVAINHYVTYLHTHSSLRRSHGQRIIFGQARAYNALCIIKHEKKGIKFSLQTLFSTQCFYICTHETLPNMLEIDRGGINLCL